MAKKKIFISHAHRDSDKVNLLQGQLAASTDIEVLFVKDGPASGGIEQLINSRIENSSMMLVVIGEHWSRWQEYEVNAAISKEVPVVGLVTHSNSEIVSPIFSSGEAPTVNWNWKDLSRILSGDEQSLSYEAPEKEVFKSPIIQLDFNKISEELTTHLLANPGALHELSPRSFEELVAYLMEKHGYEVTLTQQSRDGGVDIFALKNDGFGNFLTIVDCKKYSENRPIGIAAVRGMYGTLQIENASHGIIATTSRFTRDAQELSKQYRYQLSLKDHADIFKWINETKI